jgi:ADP-ribosylglycohydrolase
MADTGLDRALLSLGGLSIGDAFGERFFGSPIEAMERIAERALPEAPWPWTDDTEMAVGLLEVLAQHGQVEQDLLALRFARGMNPDRGYGRGAFEVLGAILEGRPWRSVTKSAFRGMGSFGNGAAMRVAPLGAFFADHGLDVVARQAELSAEVTHAHPEGIAGAVAVACATALAWTRGSLDREWLREVREATPAGYTRDGIDEALGLGDVSIYEAAKALGNGGGVTAPDTVPLCLWVASRHASSFEQAMWVTVNALGDRDTTCAIVGGIIAMRVDLPEAWRARREALPSIP